MKSEESRSRFISIELLQDIEVHQTARGVLNGLDKKIVDQHKAVIELTTKDGFVWWTTVDRFTAWMGKGAVTSKQGTYCFHVLRGEPGERTKESVTLSGVRSYATHIEKKDSWSAVDVIRELEERLEPEPGIYRCLDPQKPGPRVAPDDLLGDGPALLLIPGTAASTSATFGLLASRSAEKLEASAQEFWGELLETYQSRVFTFVHRSLSQSPLENARDLLHLLPREADLHVVTHAGGGLLGEILSRAHARNRHVPFNNNDVRVYEKAEDPEQRFLLELNDLFQDKQPRVQRLVRIAAPASGTILATEPLDVYFNVLLNAMGQVPALKDHAAVDFVRSCLVSTLGMTGDAASLPGIAAQRPDANLIRILNDTSLEIDADLRIVTGKATSRPMREHLRVFVPRADERQDSDLFVSTRSMNGGAKRTGAYEYFEDTSEVVSHFQYFKNSEARNALREGLTDTTSSDYRPLHATGHRTPFFKYRSDPKSTSNRPVLYVLPGLMGSTLSISSRRIWPNLNELMIGGAADLSIENERVEADAFVEGYYEDLIDYFSNSYEVIPYPYDWRRSMAETARELAREVDKKLESTLAPIRFLAHSTGGLLVRRMIQERYGDGEDERGEVLWQKIKDRGGRLLMLGAPTGGMFVMLRFLLGQHSSMQYLDMWDSEHTVAELAPLFASFSGLLELLPAGEQPFDRNGLGKVDLFDVKHWEEVFGSAGGLMKGRRKSVPAQVTERFDQARSFVDSWEEAQTLDPESMIYVAGVASRTPARIGRLKEAGKDKKSRTVFFATREGDGTVPWESGIPDRLKGVTWFARADHGNLPRFRSAFPAYKELLEIGETARLDPKEPLVAHRGEDPLTVLRDQSLPFLPDETLFHAEVLGAMTLPVIEKKPPRKVGVSVTLGNLSLAQYPVVVGHFRGDGIVSAEKALDWYLDGQLSNHHRMGLYPGKEETSLIVFNTKLRPPGGIVIGLGAFGELTEGILIKSMKQALLALSMKHQVGDVPEGHRVEGGLGVSPLIIGSGRFGVLSTRTSVRAILTAVDQANMQIRHYNKTEEHEGKDSLKTIDFVEFVEVYEDRAIRAIRVVVDLVQSGNFGGFELEEDAVVVKTGARRRVTNLIEKDWWHRIKVQEDASMDTVLGLPGHERSAKMKRPFKFTALTDRARAPVSNTYSSRTIVNHLLADARPNGKWNKKISKALFELLIPNHFKDFLEERNNILWILDNESAAYPWELLHSDETGEEEPLAVRAGMIRQLETPDYRQHVEIPVGNSALVVGDPVSDLIELDAAQDEARLVANMLRDYYFGTTELIREEASPEKIITTLFNDEFRILHLAGHGIFGDHSAGQETGMVIGQDMLLTAGTIEQMRRVPELVFINCCHLGRIDPDDESLRVNRFRIAANLGIQLINMGVRVVVAAGWEVSDRGAKKFAQVFYKEMLDGKMFGEAVLLARKATYQVDSSSSTWGAYQCYGDPYYRLVPPQTANEEKKPEYYTELEVILDLERLTDRISDARERYFEQLKEQLKTKISAIRTEWLKSGRVVEAIANAYYSFNMFEEAIEMYDQLPALDEAWFSFKALERKANIQVLLAQRVWTENERLEHTRQVDGVSLALTPDEKEKYVRNSARARALLEEAVHFLDTVLLLGGPSTAESAEHSADYHDPVEEVRMRGDYSSGERLSLAGSAYKRFALVKEDVAAQNAALVKSARYYKRAFDKRQAESNRIDNYTLLNWITVQLMLDVLDSTGASSSRIDAQELLKDPAWVDNMLDRAVHMAQEAEKKQPSFWNRAVQADVAFYKLLQSLLAEPEKPAATSSTDDDQSSGSLTARLVNEIIEIYGEAWNTGGSFKIRASVLQQPQWVVDMLSAHKKATDKLLAEWEGEPVGGVRKDGSKKGPDDRGEKEKERDSDKYAGALKKSMAEIDRAIGTLNALISELKNTLRDE